MARDLMSDEGSDASDSEVGGAELAPELTVNEDFAKRFEHNKKREELARLEEKLGKSSSKKRKRGPYDEDVASDSESSSSDDEDEDGEFATAALDSEILATLNAIKSKDPRVYDAESTFYSEINREGQPSKQKTDKPVFLRDYQRETLLNGVAEDKQEEPLSYNQERDLLQKSIISEMHAAAVDTSDDDNNEEGGLLVRKKKKKTASEPKPVVVVDVAKADRDPETFLSNFMAARAWVPTDRAELHPFESDDEEEEKRADQFEEAYNLRFEDPEKSNATLRSHARDIAQQYSVRRDEQNVRKKKRDAEKAAKEAAKQQLKDEKARLKKLRMEQVEEKVKRIKRAAGLKTSDLRPEDWSHFIDDDWNDDQWEAEMQRRFGDQYYAEQDNFSEASENEAETTDGSTKKKKKPKKPQFDDDLDIKDIVPDFQDDDSDAAADFSLSEDDNDQQRVKKPKKSKKQERIEKQKDSRKERRIIEQLVDDELKLDLVHALPSSSRNKSAGFRYRETSPQAFGLTPQDILLADDTALNQFAGLKKLASWRPEDRKKKDRKHLGKKARLRQWRLDTFGNEAGPTLPDFTAQDTAQPGGAGEKQNGSDDEMGGVDIIEGGRKKKGRRRKKAKLETVSLET